MRHVLALVYKYVFITAIVAVTTWWAGGASITRALWLGLVITAALYILGDLVMLRYFGNWVAAIADAAVAFLILRSGTVMPGTLTPSPSSSAMSMVMSLVAAVAIGIAEYFFHQYLLNSHTVPVAAMDGGNRWSGGSGGDDKGGPRHENP